MLSFEKKVAPMIESIYDTLTPIEKTIAKYFLGVIPENEFVIRARSVKGDSSYRFHP